MSSSSRVLLVVAASVAAGCLDPLYEDGAFNGYFVCCQAGHVSTCGCETNMSCLPSFRPCAAGTCTNALSCFGGGNDAGTGGGGGSTGGGTGGAGGGAGGGSAGGSAGGAGGGTGGGSAGGTGGGGVLDGGGGGTGGGTAGGSAGGTAGGVAGGFGGGGVPIEPVYELCCVGSVVTTCVCPNGVCANAPFTACPLGICIPGIANAHC